MMHDPSHPGEVIKHDCIEASQLTVTDAADGLGVSRKALSELINGKSGVSPDMAIRLEKAGWGTADTWLRMQMQFDLWLARKKSGKLKVKRFEEAVHAGARRVHVLSPMKMGEPCCGAYTSSVKR